jgi:mitogen-activated protein kinase 1/3
MNMDKVSAKKIFNQKAPRQSKPKSSKKIIETRADDIDFTTIEEEVGHKYQVTNQIGAGSYGNVYEAIVKGTDRKVAIKSIHSIFDDLVDCKRIMREIKILRHLDCPYVVKLYDIVIPKSRKSFNRLNIVLEYVDSDLKKLLKSSLKLEEIHIKTLMYNTIWWLKYIHSASVLHRDIKPGNILVNEDCTVRLCDFGLARSISGIQCGDNLVNKMWSEIDKGKDPANVEEFKEYKDSRKATMDDDMDIDKNAEKTLDEKREIHFKLQKTKLGRRKMKRALTGHVITRWYRAPEIILLERGYFDAIDIWSTGWIFGELLSMAPNNTTSSLQRRPLFQGNSWFPLSPAKRPMIEKDDPALVDNYAEFPIDRKDQLKMIFNILGTPESEMDISFISDKQAEDYIQIFSPKPGINLQDKYPNSSIESLDLLKRMLTFNPYFRITIDQCLNHDFFASVRDLDKENSAKKEISFSFEHEGDLSEARLRELILEEVDYFN